MPGMPGGQDAVEHVDPPGHHLNQPGRVTQTHEVAGLIGGQERRDGGQRLQHFVPGLTHAEPPDGVAVKAHLHRPLGALGPELWVGSPLDDAELALADCRVRVVQESPTAPFGPGGRPIDGLAQDLSLIHI